MKRCVLAIVLMLTATTAFGRGHGGGHGGGGHSVVPMCAGCQHKKLCRFDEIIALKASCFGFGSKTPPKVTSDNDR